MRQWLATIIVVIATAINIALWVMTPDVPPVPAPIEVEGPVTCT